MFGRGDSGGMGSPEYKLGWRREGLIEFVLHEIERDKTVSSTHLAHNVVRAAEMKEPGHKAKDDISCSVLYFRKPRKMLLFTGPPYYSERDAEYAKIFDDFQGKKAISGGTTANLLARELGRTVVTERFFGRKSSCLLKNGRCRVDYRGNFNALKGG